MVPRNTAGSSPHGTASGCPANLSPPRPPPPDARHPARAFVIPADWEIRLRSPPGRVPGMGREKGQADLPSPVPRQAWEQGGRSAPTATQVPSPARRPGRHGGRGCRVARRRARCVLAESPEPRVWTARCSRATPELTALRREPSPVLAACAGDSSGELSWGEGPRHQRVAGKCPRSLEPTLLPRGNRHSGERTSVFCGCFLKLRRGLLFHSSFQSKPTRCARSGARTGVRPGAQRWHAAPTLAQLP